MDLDLRYTNAVALFEDIGSENSLKVKNVLKQSHVIYAVDE